MPDIFCPICQRPNDSNSERCWYCQAVLPHEDQGQKAGNKGNTDWLNSFRDESAQPPDPGPAEPNAEDAENKAEEVPDWLARIRTREQFEKEAQQNVQPEPKPVEKNDELPDWLKAIKAGNSGKKVEPSQPETTSEPAKFPESEEEKKPDQSPSGQKQEDDTQDWLNRLAAWRPVDILPSDSGTETEPSADEKPAEPDAQTQIRLNSFSNQEDSKNPPAKLNLIDGWQKLIPEQPETPSHIESLEETPAKPAVEPGTSNFDVDSLRGDLFSQAATAEPATEPNEGQPVEPPQTKEHAIDRLFDLDQTGEEKQSEAKQKPAFIEDESQNTPFIQDDLPDWLSSASVEKISKKPAETISEELDASALDADLEKANLPPWLQALRPSTNDVFTGAIENLPRSSDEKGLLEGIAGTLKSPNMNGEFRKPVGYGTALKVSERQKTNANLLANMVEDALDQDEIEEPKNNKLKNTLLQLALGLGLIAVILLGKTLFAKYLVQPALFPPEVVAAYNLVNSIPVNKPVLLTADFEPAVTGELSWSSQALLENLMKRNSNFAILSTNPTGIPILMQQLTAASQKVPGYDLASHLVDFGYLPGGSTALQLMTQNLRATVPNTYDPYDVQSVWNSSVLQSVRSISDFGAVVILSDKSESARLWVEQIQPAMGKTPLLFVVSAQAAPMVEPYFQSGQVSGYLAGFSGSLAYEKIFQEPASASNHFEAFQVSILFTAILLLLGGIINLIRPDATVKKG